MVWSGANVVGPGLSTFYSDPANGSPVLAPLVSFFTAIRSFFPVGITWTIPDGGDLLNPADGTLTGTWSESGGAQVTSSGAAAFAAGVGARVVWRTSAIRGGRRVRGSTFLVPLISSQYEANGTIGNTALTTMETAAQTLLSATGGALQVWSRPRPGLAGAMVPIQSAVMPDQVSWLRSRRT